MASAKITVRKMERNIWSALRCAWRAL